MKSPYTLLHSAFFSAPLTTFLEVYALCIASTNLPLLLNVFHFLFELHTFQLAGKALFSVMVGTSAYLASTIGVWFWCRMRFFDRNPDLFRQQYLSEYKKHADEEAKHERVKTGLKDFERQRAEATAPSVQIAPVASSGSSSGAAS